MQDRHALRVTRENNVAKVEHNRITLADRICCPLCGALFHNPRQVEEISGTLVCSHCETEYPIRNSVFYGIIPAVKPEREIRTLLDRHLFWSNLDSHTLEAEYVHFLDLVRADAATHYSARLSNVCKDINFHIAPNILVSGAGAREIATWLAEKGARVVAVDFYPPELLQGNSHYLHINPESADDPTKIRYVVAFPWRLPFLNEQFDAVLHVACTPCDVPCQKLIDEMTRIAIRKSPVILFWGQEGALAAPHGDELHAGLIEPRGYLPFRNPGRTALKLDLLWAGVEHVSFMVDELNLDESQLKTRQKADVDERKEHTIRSRRAITIKGFKRKQSSARAPQAFQKHIDILPECEKFPRIIAQWTATGFIESLRALFRIYAAENTLPETIDFGKNLGFWNELGWRHTEIIGAETARYPLAHSFCYLSGHNNPASLKLHLFGVPRRVSSSYRITLDINGKEVSLGEQILPGWQTRIIDLTDIENKDVLEIYLKQENLFRMIDSFSIFDYRSLGIGVKNISTTTH